MLALDVLLLFMIAVCIIYCWILNQRIRDLHNSRIEFARMIKEFDAAVIKAENCIDDLTSLSKSSNDQVKKSTKAAEGVIQELQEVYEIGDKTCSNLESAISEARKCQKALIDGVKGSKEQPSKVVDIALEEAEQMSEEELAYDKTDYIEDSAMPEHKNLLEKVLDKITTHRSKGESMDQSNYYDTLRKLSVRK